VKDEIAKRNT